jgi:hypothetical protein
MMVWTGEASLFWSCIDVIVVRVFWSCIGVIVVRVKVCRGMEPF